MFKTYQWLLAGLCALLILSGCSRYEPYAAGTVIDIEDKSSAILELQEVSVPPPTPEPLEGLEYRVGAGDVLSINVPGLIDGHGSDEKTQQSRVGFRVYTSGKILLPLVGGIEVAGKTVEEIQLQLQDVFTAYIKKPVVTVEILEFKSQPLYLLGKFNYPGLYYLDRPTSLLHGIALGSGLQDTANMRGARLLREDDILPVDIYQLLYNNDLRQNVKLRPGDTIYVPGDEEAQVFVFGAVANSGAVSMANGRLNLVQALSTAGVGGGTEGKPYDREHIRIIRSLSPTRGQLMVVDLAKMMNGQALPMPLMDGDIVYVPKTRIGNWNEAINELIPTFQAIGAVLQPFVQIKYLEDDD